MSARAAWRLAQLGFSQPYDYGPSKLDWFAHGLPREGAFAAVPWAGDLARTAVPVARPGERIGELRGRVADSGLDFCVVCNDRDVVLGLLRGDALGKDDDSDADSVMELGPKTIRPNTPAEELLRSRPGQGSKTWIVTDPSGVLLGVLFRSDVERAVEPGREGLTA
jgi:CBS domain-containing protein